MIQDVAAKRYAEAAHLLAREEGKEEAWAAGLAAMAQLFHDPQAQVFLESSRVPLAAKQGLLDKALSGADPLVMNLARLLLRRGRTSLGPQIAEAYQEILDEAKGISHAVVTSAVPLSADDLRAVQRRLREMTGGEVVFQTQVDDGILGGLIVRIGDRLIDGSTRSRLQALKSAIGGGARV